MRQASRRSLNGGVVDVAAAHQGTLKRPLLFGRGLELVLVGFVNALLFHTRYSACLAEIR